jgi:putative endonuclease
MASKSRTLYTGVTSNLERRVWQHRTKRLAGFTARYNITRLVCFEVFGEITDAIAREKRIKSWSRGKKIALIESVNRDWRDLSAAWFGGQSELQQTQIPRCARNDIVRGRVDDSPGYLARPRSENGWARFRGG